MEERIFFEYGDVMVTNARFINGAQIYAMSNVTSVKPYEKKPNRLVGVIAFLLGIAFVAEDNLLIGFVVSCSAAYYLYQQRPFTTYYSPLRQEKQPRL